MRRFNRKHRNYMIVGLCAILLIMTVGYAAFASNLKISGTSNINSNFLVKITNIEVSNKVGGAADKTGVTTHTDTTATFGTTLQSPGDSITYDITIENQGNIDAILKTITKTDTNNSAILFTTSGVNEGDELDHGATAIMKVTVTYNPSVTSQPDNLESTLKVELDYEQTDGTTVTPPVEAEPVMQSWDMDSSEDFHSDEYRSNITSIDVLTNKNVPSEAVESWDVSEAKDGSVMAWVVNDPMNAGKYKLYIGGNGGVAASDSLRDMFYSFRSLQTANLVNLDTSNVTNMSRMFIGCWSLTDLNLSNFNTSQVTNMSSMFSACISLTSLVLSNFDTSNVTDMSRMFNGCESLVTLNLSNFDTSNVTYMQNMFIGCSSLTELDLSSFNTSKVTEMMYMFHSCSKLATIYVGDGWVTTDPSATFDMFYGCLAQEVTHI